MPAIGDSGTRDPIHLVRLLAHQRAFHDLRGFATMRDRVFPAVYEPPEIRHGEMGTKTTMATAQLCNENAGDLKPRDAKHPREAPVELPEGVRR